MIDEQKRFIQVEQCVLNQLLGRDGAFDMVSDVVIADDFDALRHQIIYQAVSDLAMNGKPYDQVMVMDENPAKRRNRIALLAGLRRLFLQVADISLLQ